MAVTAIADSPYLCRRPCDRSAQDNRELIRPPFTKPVHLLMNCLLSCFTNSYGRFGAEVCIARVRSAGLTHVELPIKTAGVASIFQEQPILTDHSTSGDVARVRRLLERHQVQLSSCNITSGNPLEAHVVTATERKLDLARQLDVGLVVGGAGEATGAAQRAVLLEHLRRIGDVAEAHEIVYCCETHPGFCRNADAMLETMQELDHPHLRINFDTGNVLFYNEGTDVLDELRRVRDWVRHVHLKDHNGRAGDWHFPACGRGGAVDFGGVKGILDEAEFSGPCSLEIEGIQGESPLSLEEHHERVSQSVRHLRSAGFR